MATATEALPDRLLTPDALAPIFGIKPGTLSLWVRLGKFPRPIQIGNRSYWHPAAIRSFLDRNTVGADLEPSTC